MFFDTFVNCDFSYLFLSTCCFGIEFYNLLNFCSWKCLRNICYMGQDLPEEWTGCCLWTIQRFVNILYIYIYSLWRRANARNVRLYYPYWQYTDLFIFRMYIYIRNIFRISIKYENTVWEHGGKYFLFLL